MRPASIVLLLTAAVACSSSPKVLDRSEQKQRAAMAKSKLFETLGTRLREVISDRGPSAAISVCANEADAMTSRVGSELGLRIGRTSDKLRNPENAVPAWAASLITKQPGEPVFASLPGGELGALFPIILKKMCENCHGDPSLLTQPVRDALVKRYPHDRATGYKEGDLRGWFWLEVPAANNKLNGTAQ